jgi:hypothetical protein
MWLGVMSHDVANIGVANGPPVTKNICNLQMAGPGTSINATQSAPTKTLHRVRWELTVPATNNIVRDMQGGNALQQGHRCSNI